MVSCRTAVREIFMESILIRVPGASQPMCTHKRSTWDLLKLNLMGGGWEELCFSQGCLWCLSRADTSSQKQLACYEAVNGEPHSHIGLVFMHLSLCCIIVSSYSAAVVIWQWMRNSCKAFYHHLLDYGYSCIHWYILTVVWQSDVFSAWLHALDCDGLGQTYVPWHL